MRPLKKRVLSFIEKRWLYGITAILWLTGTIWFVLHSLTPEGEYGSFTQSMLLRIHGIAAMAFLFVLGIIFHHIPPGWKNKNQRISGVPLLSICVILTLTGWGLYYLGQENWRSAASLIHSALGIVLPLIILAHIWKIIFMKSK